MDRTMAHLWRSSYRVAQVRGGAPLGHPLLSVTVRYCPLLFGRYAAVVALLEERQHDFLLRRAQARAAGVLQRRARLTQARMQIAHAREAKEERDRAAAMRLGTSEKALKALEAGVTRFLSTRACLARVYQEVCIGYETPALTSVIDADDEERQGGGRIRLCARLIPCFYLAIIQYLLCHHTVLA